MRPLPYLMPLVALLAAACDRTPGEPSAVPPALSLPADTLAVELGDTVTLVLSGARPGERVYWTSRDRRVITVTADGLVRAVGPGRTWLVSSTGDLGDSAHVAVDARLTEIHAGIDMTCARAAGGEALCWGWNVDGVLGVGTRSNHDTPRAVEGGHAFTALLVMGTTTCGRSTHAGLLCWGWNGTYQLGDGSNTTRTAPGRTGIPETVRRLATGAGATVCGFDPTEVLCWGWNGYNQLLDGSYVSRRRPAALDAGRPLRDIATGGGHVCGLDGAGRAWCWGRGESGQLGDGLREHRAIPVAVAGGRAYVQIVTGFSHACARDATGAAWCWGAHHGDTATGLPRRVGAALAFDTLVTSHDHTCGLAAGAAWCWGVNDRGQLGASGREGATEFEPVPVAGGLTFRQLTTGSRHTCGIATDGFAWCWGENVLGALGDGTRILRDTPVRVRYQRGAPAS